MLVAKWYTRASRVRIVIAKFDGRWKLPGGPYPIPELVALVGGILATLFLLPRLGNPLLTGLAGLGITAGLVAAMRRMPYSPVKFGTRVHRTMRLYTTPVSVSVGDDWRARATASLIRPQIEILDILPANAAPAALYAPPPQLTPPDPDGWAGLLHHPRSAAAELFG
jgi:hypothetical protein